MRVILTGGHAATTAYAFAETALAKHSDWELFFIGSRSAVEGRAVSPLEAELLPKLGVRYLPLTTGRLQRRLSLQAVVSALKIPFGIFQAVGKVKALRPDLILSFGGFVGFPVAFAGWFWGVPVILHEQTSVIGRANLYALAWAKKIALSRDSSREYIPRRFWSKIVLTGNPVNTQFRQARRDRKKMQTILFHGGSRGSMFLNQQVSALAKKLLSCYRVIHQTGSLGYTQALALKAKLPPALRSKYIFAERFYGQQWVNAFKAADLVVSRAGANICSDLLVARLPALFIPIPFSYLQEQTVNAQKLVNLGVAEMSNQTDTTPDTVLDLIKKMDNHYQKYALAFKNYESEDLMAAERLLSVVERTLP